MLDFLPATADAGVPTATGPLPVDLVPLESLVEHHGAVPADLCLEELYGRFRSSQVDFLALEREGRVIGLCSRVQLGTLLGSRYGFSLFSRSPAADVAVEHPLIFTVGTPVRRVLAQSLARHGGEFHEDVVLVDKEGRLIGLIPVERLAHVQNRLVQEQIGQLERQHSAMQRQEKQALLDTLAGGIAHELNNKLAPVQGFAELMEQQATGDARQHLQLIGRSVREAAKIVRQLLQLSKPSQPSLQMVDLVALAEECLLILKFNLREARCEAVLERPSSAVLVRADAAQLKQVIINLAINALQAMDSCPKPELRVRIALVEGRARLIVQDNGEGIPPEHLSRIFDPFFTTKGPDRGTGLGLSVCFSIVRQHGGDIDVQSAPGQGASFTVMLPAEAETPPREDPLPAAFVPARAGTGRGRVLVADDEVIVRLMLQEMLRAQFRCEVDLAANGREALALAAHRHYDLVVSDIRMPEMTGAEFFLRLKEANPALAERFIFITGHPGQPELREEIARWKIPVLAKPFTVPELVEVCLPRLPQAVEAA